MLPSPVFVPINGFKSPKEEPENQTTENTEDLLQVCDCCSTTLFTLNNKVCLLSDVSHIFMAGGRD